MTTNRSRPYVAAILLSLLSSTASGQDPLARTRTVDPSGNADWEMIQEAIDDIPDDPSVRWTVLVYAGTYPEAIVLGDEKKNVDIVGVDRDAVVISAPADSDAITIKGVGARNNTIRNLTIRTNDASVGEGRGIVIDKEGTGDDPSGVRIVGVTIETQAANSDGVYVDGDVAGGFVFRDVAIVAASDASRGIHFAGAVSHVEITGTSITTGDGHAIEILNSGTTAPEDFRLTNVTLTTGSSSADGVHAKAIDGLAVRNCEIRSGGDALSIDADSGIYPSGVALTNVTAEAGSRSLWGKIKGFTIDGCRLIGGTMGLSLELAEDGVVTSSEIRGKGIAFELANATRNTARDCLIVAQGEVDSGGLNGLRVDTSSPGNENPLTVIASRIEARNGGEGYARAVFVDASPVILIDCEMIAVTTYKTDAGEEDGVGEKREHVAEAHHAVAVEVRPAGVGDA